MLERRLDERRAEREGEDVPPVREEVTVAALGASVGVTVTELEVCGPQGPSFDVPPDAVRSSTMSQRDTAPFLPLPKLSAAREDGVG